MEYSSNVSKNVGALVQVAGANVNYAGPMIFHVHQTAAYQLSSDLQPDASAPLTLPSSSDIEASMINAVANSNGWASKEEWTKRKAEIKQLYVHEKKTLTEVKRLMEERHGFRATDKMYKTHIKQWGLDKKNKEPEMRAIVRKHKQRADQGKGSIIHVRGQIRTIVEAFRYWERKAVSIDEIIARHTASPTPEAVKFFTPVSSPILTPQVLAIPERLFRLTRDYIKGCFESGTWFSADPLCECRSIKDEHNALSDWRDVVAECRLADSLSTKALSHKAEQTLSKAITRVNGILLAEHPATLTELFGLIVTLRRREKPEMALVILRQFSVTGKAVLGSEHPFSRVCEWFQKVHESDWAEIVVGYVQIFHDQLESLFGSLHVSTIYSRMDLIWIKTQEGKARTQEFRKLLRECERATFRNDSRVMEIRGWLVDGYIFEGCYDEAMSLIQTNIAHFEDRFLTNGESLDHSRDLFTLARCQRGLGEVDSGIATLHQAIDIRVSILGTHDAQARDWLLCLEDWYLEQGLWDSAAVARELSVIAQEPMDAD